MRERTLKITNETGLHSRPADLFVRTARLYESKITVFKDSKSADAKNIVKVILLNAGKDSEVRIVAEGTDEEEAIEDLGRLIESDFQIANERVRFE